MINLNQQIIDCLNTYYGIKAITLTLLPWGADMSASIYKVEAQDQSFYFVKLKYDYHHDINSAVLQLLHHARIQQIIAPIETIHGQFSQRTDNFTLIVYPFMEGQNGFNDSLTDEQWLSFGKTLQKIHEFEIPLPIQQQVRRETYSSKWREIVRSLLINIETKPFNDELMLKLSAFIKDNILLIHRLVDRAEQLARMIKNESHKFVLCHSDVHAGNVLISKNNAIYIVDWDNLMMAPKERDLMFIGGGVGNVWNKPYEEALFYQGYGKTEVNLAMLAYYRHERIIEDIALYGQDLFLTTEGENRLEMYQHFIAMFEPNGVVDMALKTDNHLKNTF